MSDHIIGPTLPPNWKTDRKASTVDKHPKTDKEEAVYGPTLPPPQLKPKPEEPKPSSSRSIGPTLPPGFTAAANSIEDSDSDSDDMIGPIPPTHHKYDKIDHKFKDCAKNLAEKESQKPVKQEREEWMTTAPKELPLSAKIPTKSVKHFSQRSVKSDDKSNHKKYKRNDKREEELSQFMDSYNKSQKRDVSLIDIHNQKTKKSKKSEPKLEERVPFDPDKDLAVRRMDARQTKSVLNKAKTFNDRFSLGINKFL